MKFTFKKFIHTGRWKYFQSEFHDIKLNKIIVGEIFNNKRSDDTRFGIRLMIEKKDIMEDNNPNCSWRNIILIEKFNTAQEAKDFLNKNIDYFLERYTLKKGD